MQIGFYFDQTRCTGCMACRVACKDWHDIPAGPVNWMRVRYTEKRQISGRVRKLYDRALLALPGSCPACPRCPAGAITKRKEDGIVVREQRCLPGQYRMRREVPQGLPLRGAPVRPRARALK